MNENKYFAVIDVETNWNNEAMSIGIVVASCADFSAADKRYYILYPECTTGGIYSNVLRDVDSNLITDCSRAEAIADINSLFNEFRVRDILAYNAPFDCKCMPELRDYVWRDILPIAANRNTNTLLPDCCEYFSTGLLKRGRGVENVLRLIYKRDYTEIHNGLCDALDELLLIKLINLPIDAYKRYISKQTVQNSAAKTYKPREPSLLNSYRYVVDELCGGSVRLTNIAISAKDGNAYEGRLRPARLYLECSRCFHKWTQDAEAFFQSPKCPECGKK